MYVCTYACQALKWGACPEGDIHMYIHTYVLSLAALHPPLYHYKTWLKPSCGVCVCVCMFTCVCAVCVCAVCVCARVCVLCVCPHVCVCVCVCCACVCCAYVCVCMCVLCVCACVCAVCVCLCVCVCCVCVHTCVCVCCVCVCVCVCVCMYALCVNERLLQLCVWGGESTLECVWVDERNRKSEGVLVPTYTTAFAPGLQHYVYVMVFTRQPGIRRFLHSVKTTPILYRVFMSLSFVLHSILMV